MVHNTSGLKYKIIMTAPEKAKELFDKFHKIPLEDNEQSFFYAKQCALIAAGLLINEYKLGSADYQYWQEVKEEIEKL